MHSRELEKLSALELLTRESKWFNPHTAFLDLKIVRITVFLILLMMISSAIAIILNDNLSFDFSSRGFNHAALLFKVPIGIGTLSIPALALLAANHRSEQTKQQMLLTTTQITRTDRQIKISQGQNFFSNYFKHLEEFEKRYRKKENIQSFYVIDAHKMHARLFPDAARGELSVAKSEYFEFAESTAAAFLDIAIRFETPLGWENNAYAIKLLIEGLVKRFKIALPGYAGSEISVIDGHERKTFTLPGGSALGLLTHSQKVFEYVNEILSFDAEYRTPPALKNVITARFETLESPPQGQFHPFDIQPLLAEAVFRPRE